MEATGGAHHVFHAVAFVENLSLKDLASAYPEARRTPHELAFRLPSGGDVYIYPFGAIVFRDAPPADRDAELARLGARAPGADQRHGHRGVHGARGSGEQGDRVGAAS